MKQNRFISLFLIIAVLITSLAGLRTESVSAFVSEETADFYNNRKALLESLGVVAELENAEDDMSEEVFVKGVCMLLGYKSFFEAQEKNAREFAREQGFYGNGIVKNIASAQDAYVIVLNALGYNLMAASYGGTKASYARIAVNEGLSDNVKYAESFTNEIAVTILYNALFMNFFEQSGKNGYSKVKGTVLERTFEAYESEGLVTAVYLQSIAGQSPEFKDEIVINNITYKTKMDEFYHLFGKYVKFYYTVNDGVKELLYAWCDRKSFTTIDASMVTDINKKGKTYEIKFEGMRGESFKESVTPKFVSINGEKADLSSRTIEEILDFYTGEITLTDTDKNGIYDCIIASEYENYLVSMVSDKAVYDVNGLTPLYLSDEDDDDDLKYWYDVYINGKKDKLSAAFKNDVLSVYKNSSGNIIKISSSRKELNGTVDSVVKDERGTRLIIDGLPYYNPPGMKIPATGSSGVFYLDQFNVIAGFELKDIYSFAYIIKAAEESLGKLQVKLCKEGEEGARILDCARKVSVRIGNGKSEKCNAERVLEILNSNELYMPGLIKFKTNANGEIDTIILPIDNSENPLEADTTQFHYVGRAPEEEVKFGSNKMGRFAVVADDVVAFSIPTGDNIKDSDYKGNLKLKNDTPYMTPMYYNIDPYLTAGAVVVFHKTYSDGLVFPTEDMNSDKVDMSVIKDIRLIGDSSDTGFSVEFTFLGTNGEFKGYAPYSEQGLVYCQNMLQRKYDENGNRISGGMGSLVDYPVVYDTTKLFDEDCDWLNVGDMVMVRVNEDLRIDGMKRFWSNKRNWLKISDAVDMLSYIDGYMVGAPDWDFTRNNWYVFGKMTNRNADVIVIDATNEETYDGEGADPRHESIHEDWKNSASQQTYGGAAVFPAPKDTDAVYILERSKNNEVRMGTVDDMRAGDELVFFIKYGKYKGVLVVK